MNFVFIDKTNMGDDRQAGFVDLALVAGAEADWGNGYIHVYLIDVGEPLKVYFRSSDQLKHEFLRLVTAIDTYFEKAREEVERAYTRH